MTNRKIILLAIAGLYIISVTACKKYDEALPLRNDPGLPLTDSLLNYSRTHFFLKTIVFEREYISSSGKTDSIVQLPVYNDIEQQRVDFDDIGTSGKTSFVWGDQNPVNLTIPVFGRWNLSADGKQLTISPNLQFPGGGPGGTYTVSYFPDPSNLYTTPYQIDGKITRVLPDNRKLIEKFTLQAALY